MFFKSFLTCCETVSYTFFENSTIFSFFFFHTFTADKFYPHAGAAHNDGRGRANFDVILHSPLEGDRAGLPAEPQRDDAQGRRRLSELFFTVVNFFNRW